MAVPRAQGYKYDCSFRIDNEIVSTYKHHRDHNQRYLFEFRANFIIKPIDGPDHITGSERFALRSDGGFGSVDLLYNRLHDRLTEYWMTRAEIRRLIEDAFAFASASADAEKTLADSRRVIPTVVDIKISTVQPANERLDSVMSRAVRVENLIPAFLSPGGGDSNREVGYNGEVLHFLRSGLPRIRVQYVGQGSALMRVCPVCETGPHIGAQISILPGCRHSFHSGCIVRWLLLDNLCPLCEFPVYQSSLLHRGRRLWEEQKGKKKMLTS